MDKGLFDYDPLEMLLNKYDYLSGSIQEIFSGKRYTGVLLEDGRIGVCSNFGETPLNSVPLAPDLSQLPDRIFLTAYFNALLNYSEHDDLSPDVTDAITVKHYNSVVMLGFIKPVFNQLRERGIDLTVFDLQREEPELTDISLREEYLAGADAIIMSSTAIPNGTFNETLHLTKDDAEIFILGPSSTMARDFFEYPKVKMIFGSVFKAYDKRVMETIRSGEGTRKFLKFGEKKVIAKERKI